MQVFLDVATVLTVYGIETDLAIEYECEYYTLQQSLPFTVLKLDMHTIIIILCMIFVATVLTVYGIETCYYY